MDNLQKMIEQLDTLLAEYDKLAQRSQQHDLSDLPAESQVLVNRLQAAIDRFTVPAHTYARQADLCRADHAHIKLPKLLGIAAALRDDLKAGWFESITELVHAETYSDFLEMAEELCRKGYKDPAAVIAGTSLEVHLRALCGKYGVDVEIDGKPKKADVINADLKKEFAYEMLQQKLVTSWLAVRNAAAHGQYQACNEAEVRTLIDGVRGFILKYPA